VIFLVCDASVPALGLCSTGSVGSWDNGCESNKERKRRGAAFLTSCRIKDRDSCTFPYVKTAYRRRELCTSVSSCDTMMYQRHIPTHRDRPLSILCGVGRS
jgi:hypothetical protein